MIFNQYSKLMIYQITNQMKKLKIYFKKKRKDLLLEIYQI